MRCLADDIAGAELELRDCVALVGRLAVEARRHRKVLRHALTIVIAGAEAALRYRGKVALAFTIKVVTRLRLVPTLIGLVLLWRDVDRVKSQSTKAHDQRENQRHTGSVRTRKRST